MTTNKNNLDDATTSPQNVEAGRLIANLRTDVGLTQERLAVQLNVSRSAVAGAETGRIISKPFVAALKSRFPENEEQIERIEELVGGSSAKGSETVEKEGGVDRDEDMFSKRATNANKLLGTWFALWESTADNEEVINSEEIRVSWSRGSVVMQNVAISPDNPEGGYLWRSEGKLFDNQYYLATYIAREPAVISKGCLYLVVHHSGKYLEGRWIGCNYDGNWANGLVVMAKTRERLPGLLNRHRVQIPSHPYNIVREA